MIREATESDVPRLVDMGLTFVRLYYADVLQENPEQLEATIRGLLTNEQARILVAENGNGVEGMISFMVSPHPFSGEMDALELAWWVEPEARGTVGLKLLREAGQAATRMGAKRLVMISPNRTIDTLYGKLGYRELERVFQRTL
jgi:N-acetylglutamate synthase-like GNAT family acetyltransferase